MKKLKIAVDARTLGSRPSGVGMYLNDFLEQLITYDEFEWILFTDVKESEYIKRFEARGIKVIEWGKPVYRSAGVYAYFAFIKKELKQVRPDIFWEVNSIIPINLGGSFKTLITIHDMFPIQYVRYFGKIYSYYFKFNLGVTLRHTDMILYNSEQTKDDTEMYFPKAKKIPSCNAYIISNPLTRYVPPKDENYFLYVGNMEKRKGVDILIKAEQDLLFLPVRCRRMILSSFLRLHLQRLKVLLILVMYHTLQDMTCITIVHALCFLLWQKASECLY